MSRVLVVEDDPQLLRAMRITLHARGHDVLTAATGRKALSEAAAARPDLIVLDLGLPDLDGVEVIQGLRGWTSVPIIVLSGRTSGGDKVAALDAGADDYVTKPFGIEELLARIRAVSRRAIAPDGGVPAVDVGPWRVDLADRRVTGDGGEVKLTPTEWRLLEVFVRHPGKLIGQRQLLTEVWGPASTGDTSSLRLYLNRLRRKLEPDPSRPRHLLTEPGLGYRFEP
ncbi:MAG TPA: response regulator [Mycobacteriales bacterium]|nr:response regulator [Mycobacteriales bacterium]